MKSSRENNEKKPKESNEKGKIKNLKIPEKSKNKSLVTSVVQIDTTVENDRKPSIDNPEINSFIDELNNMFSPLSPALQSPDFDSLLILSSMVMVHQIPFRYIPVFSKIHSFYFDFSIFAAINRDVPLSSNLPKFDP